MKNALCLTVVLGVYLGLAGCDSSGPGGGASAPTNSTTSGELPRADIRANNGNVDVEVGPPGEKPGVDVDVKPGGDVDVNIDGDKIRERIEERREGQETLPDR